MRQLKNTGRLDSVSQTGFDTVFYPGGHGPPWDLAEDPNSIKLLESFIAQKKSRSPSSAMHRARCCAIPNLDGTPFVWGKRVTGFTNSEEEGVGLTKVVPFLVEDELGLRGAKFKKTSDWQSLVVRDGLLITGQNPASSGPTAGKLLEVLGK